MIQRFLAAAATCLFLLATACSSPSVYVARHGEAHSNLKPRPRMTAAELDNLTGKGCEEARAMAEELRGAGIELILHSPTGRTSQTAQIVGQLLGVPLVETEELLSLRGSWTGRMEAWARGEDPRPEGGESMADGVARIRALVAEQGNRTILLVTHSDIAAALIGEDAGTPIPQRMDQHKPKTGAVQVVSGLR